MMIGQKKIRLSRFLADCGIGSRRNCGDLIKDGRVSVNNTIIRDLSFSVVPGDIVSFDNKVIKSHKKIVLAVNKPVGFLSTAKDDFKRKTVIDLAGSTGKRLYPAGRLDKDSRGLIILTNDGDLAYRITHPRYNIPKTYEVFLDRPITDKQLEEIKNGVIIDKKVFKPDEIKKTAGKRNGFPLSIRIHEGRKRIIRRAFKKIGYNVTDLKRTMIGKYSLGDIPEGEYRVLYRDDLDKLMMIQ